MLNLWRSLRNTRSEKKAKRTSGNSPRVKSRFRPIVEGLEDRFLLSNSVLSQFFYGGLNRLSDDSGEFLFNRAGGNTTLDVNDILLTSFEVNTVEDISGAGGGTHNFANGSNNEFTGFSAIQVTAKTPVGTSFRFDFGPVDAAGRAAVTANMGSTAPISLMLNGMAASSMIVLFDDGGTNNFTRLFNSSFLGPDDRPGGPANPGDVGIGPFVKENLLASSTQTSPTKLFEVGRTGAAGEGWFANAPSDNVASVAAGSPGLNFGTVNFAINVTANQAGLVFGLVGAAPVFTGSHQFVGNANLQGVGLGQGPGLEANTAYDAFDDFNATFKPLVPAPRVDIEKKTDGPSNTNTTAPDFDNEDAANGVGVPVLTPGTAVTWTYKVTNTGNVGFTVAQVVVTDNHMGVTPVRDASTDVGSDGILSPGEMWIYTATGTVQDLGVGGVYENLGTVVVPGGTDADLSHYRNVAPLIDIEKTTNGTSNTNTTAPDFDNEDAANGVGVPILTPGSDVTWTYKVTNTGSVSLGLADVTVTDSVAGVTPIRDASTDVGSDNILSPGEMWIYRATGTVLSLAIGGVYTNTGTVTITGGGTDSDLSHYRNPPPQADIEKTTNATNPLNNQNTTAPNFDNEDAANGAGVPVVLPGTSVTWTYKVTNTGTVDIPLAALSVTDSQGVTPVRDASTDVGSDGILSPGEMWIYTATGTALDLGVSGVYENEGKVTVTGGNTDTDLSHYRNPGAALGDRVWIDTNVNGIQDNGEVGKPGVTVHLKNNLGNIIATTTTDANGLYLFSGLAAGTYSVQFVLPSAFLFTLVDQGANDAVDSDAQRIGTMIGMTTQTYTLATGQINLTVDAGVFPEVLGQQGGTPGFWKNHLEAWPATGLTPGQLVSTIFTVPTGLPYSSIANQTLLQAISAGGGGVTALMRQAVCAILNALHPQVAYPVTFVYVVTNVNAALASNNATFINNLQNELAGYNNLAHPL